MKTEIKKEWLQEHVWVHFIKCLFLFQILSQKLKWFTGIWLIYLQTVYDCITKNDNVFIIRNTIIKCIYRYV